VPARPADPDDVAQARALVRAGVYWRAELATAMLRRYDEAVDRAETHSRAQRTLMLERVPLVARIRELEEALKECCYMFEWCEDRYGDLSRGHSILAKGVKP
jgi:hypothetical protein